MQSKDLWSIRIDFPLKPDDARRMEIENVMEELGLSLSSFEEGKGRPTRYPTATCLFQPPP